MPVSEKELMLKEVDDVLMKALGLGYGITPTKIIAMVHEVADLYSIPVVDETVLRKLGWQCDRNGTWTHPLTPGQFNLMTAIEVTARAIEGYEGNQDPDWKPEQRDIDWLNWHLAKFGDTGVWRLTDGEFQIYKANKQAVLLKGDPQKGSIKQSIMVFESLGWTVVVIQGGKNGGEEKVD